MCICCCVLCFEFRYIIIRFQIIISDVIHSCAQHSTQIMSKIHQDNWNSTLVSPSTNSVILSELVQIFTLSSTNTLWSSECQSDIPVLLILKSANLIGYLNKPTCYKAHNHHDSKSELKPDTKLTINTLKVGMHLQ